MYELKPRYEMVGNNRPWRMAVQYKMDAAAEIERNSVSMRQIQPERGE